jgi:hypothetical protein
MTKESMASCQSFVCSKEPDINKFFHEEYLDYENQLLGKSYCFVKRDGQNVVAAFTVANSSVRVDNMPNPKRNQLNRHIPFSKQRSQYPAVLLAQLAVFDGFGGNEIGKEVVDFIKSWFINPLNKTGCRYLVVDAINTPKVLDFYRNNGFEYIFASDEEEMQYMSRSIKVDNGTVFRKTRLMVYDLMQLKVNLQENK